VTFVWSGRPDTMRMLVYDVPTVEAACNYIATGTGPHIPIGPIIRGSGVDRSIPFHYRPELLRLTEAAIELCDGKLMRTPAEVDEFFLGATGSVTSPTATFCPWGARPVSVE
jgi:hypothetical protein